MSARISFYGSREAELFTREVEESFYAVRHKNLVRNTEHGMEGFVGASVDGRPFWNTMWTRDTSVFLRELVMMGCFEDAKLVAKNLIKLVDLNEQGFYTFPEYFDYGVKSFGSELDGTCAIMIGMALLWEHSPADDPIRTVISDFLTGEKSPTQYILYTLETEPFVRGTGEFGCGCQVGGECYNVVQNMLVVLSLTAIARMARAQRRHEYAEALKNKAKKVLDNMRRYFVRGDGSWVWALDILTLTPDERVNNLPVNKGTALINGVLSMAADVLGFALSEENFPVLKECSVTFDRLMKNDRRRELFDRYGMFSQFDEFWPGATCPSYGQGYAVQAMLLLDKIDMYSPAIDFMADIVYNPIPEYKLNRESRYYIHEIYYTPYSVGRMKIVEGCGALNLVGVAETVKIARMMVGADDSEKGNLKIIPRLPRRWKGYSVKGLPLLSNGEVFACDIDYAVSDKGESFIFTAPAGKTVKSLSVRFKGGYRTYRDIGSLTVSE